MSDTSIFTLKFKPYQHYYGAGFFQRLKIFIMSLKATFTGGTMKKKRLRKLKPVGIGALQAKKQRAVEELGGMKDELDEIFEKARVLWEPRYTDDDYIDHLCDWLSRSKKKRPMKDTLKLISDTGVDAKAGSNQMLVLIKATARFETKKAGKMARKLSDRLTRSLAGTKTLR